MPYSRRHFLYTAGVFSLGMGGLHRLVREVTARPELLRAVPERYGPLVPDPDGLLDLPRGFRYHLFSRAGERMSDGLVVPGSPDGMAAFPGPDGLTLLVRNHEVDTDEPTLAGPFGARGELLDGFDQSYLFDPGADGTPCLGGTTTLLYDTRAGRLEAQHLSLAGTVRNCAGGPTPWGSWITCEETVERVGPRCTRDHGYNFEVPATAEPGLAEPVPLTAMGRFNHEAVAVEPRSGIVYQTEDRPDGLIYRFLPDVPGRLREGGRLQALAVADAPRLDTRNWEEEGVRRGDPLPVAWIDVDNVEAPDDDLRYRGFEAGAARFARGEGMWYGRGAVFFACTNGGRARKGQIWRYTPSPAEGTPAEAERPGSLELFIEPNNPALVDRADNLTVAPWGDLVVCEDGSGEQFLVGVTPEGGIYKLARNAVGDSEFAGATFSPDGSTLFVNIMEPGLTLAITGAWEG